MPEPWDARNLETAVDNVETEAGLAIAEVSRLRAVIDTDDHLARIADLEEDLEENAVGWWNTAVLANTLTATIGTLNVEVAKLEQERDTAQASNEEAQELLAEAHAELVVERTAVYEQLQEIERLGDTIATLEQQRADDRLTIADLAQRLADCQGPDPEPNRLVIGASDKLGYPDMAARLAVAGDVPLGAFTHYIAGPRFTTAELDKMAVYVADGVVPSLSFHVGTEADTVYNVDQLFARGWDTLVGGYSIGNEPTQKDKTPAEWRAANQYAATVLPDSWTLVLGPFQRVDIHAIQTDPRFIGNWLGADLSWIWDAGNVALGVNVYDKNHSVAQTFEQLVTFVGASGYSVETYAELLGVRLWIREAGAPEEQTGEWTRPVGWKPDWYRAMYAYAAGKLDLYELIDIFCSYIGGDPPPEGWWAWTSEEAWAAFLDILRASRAAQP